MFRRALRLQYVSDVHVDANKVIPIIEPVSDTLAICGDVGHPYSPYFSEFMEYCSRNFKNVLFVPGNHDFDCSPKFDKEKVEKYTHELKTICKKYGVHYMNQNVVDINNITIAGTTLWSNAIGYDNEQHKHEVDWLKGMINNTKNNMAVITHFVPSFKLIVHPFDKYPKYRTSWFASDLDHMICDPVSAWLCGHSHSKIETRINNVYCGVNAFGHINKDKYKSIKYKQFFYKSKYVDIIE